MHLNRLIVIGAVALLAPIVLTGLALVGSTPSETTVASQATAAYHDVDQAVDRLGGLVASGALRPASGDRNVQPAAQRAKLGFEALPQAARGPVAQALGRHDRAYHAPYVAFGETAEELLADVEAHIEAEHGRVRSERKPGKSRNDHPRPKRRDGERKP